MRSRIVVAFAVTLGVTAVAAGQGSTRWVDRTKADVRAGKASFHDVVDTVLKGEQVQVVKTEEKWMNITTPRGKSGWLFEQALSANAVAPGEGSKFLKNVGGDASTSATAASTGAKGIYAQEYARSKGYDYSVVTWIEGNQPSAAENEAFAQAGAGK